MRFSEKLGVWVPHELSENNKKIAFKLLLNISPAIEQHAVTNSVFCTESSREMRNGAYLYKYEAKKGMGGSWRYAKAEG